MFFKISFRVTERFADQRNSEHTDSNELYIITEYETQPVNVVQTAYEFDQTTRVTELVYIAHSRKTRPEKYYGVYLPLEKLSLRLLALNATPVVTSKCHDVGTNRTKLPFDVGGCSSNRIWSRRREG